eukprot:scaffold143435_cov43-Prasinocladus_malaysianus.AAC.3
MPVNFARLKHPTSRRCCGLLSVKSNRRPPVTEPSPTLRASSRPPTWDMSPRSWRLDSLCASVTDSDGPENMSDAMPAPALLFTASSADDLLPENSWRFELSSVSEIGAFPGLWESLDAGEIPGHGLDSRPSLLLVRHLCPQQLPVAINPTTIKVQALGALLGAKRSHELAVDLPEPGVQPAYVGRQVNYDPNILLEIVAWGVADPQRACRAVGIHLEVDLTGLMLLRQPRKLRLAPQRRASIATHANGIVAIGRQTPDSLGPELVQVDGDAQVGGLGGQRGDLSRQGETGRHHWLIKSVVYAHLWLELPLSVGR